MTRSRWYSPQLSRELVSRLYFKAKAEGIPMTRLLDQIVGRALDTKNGVEMQTPNESINARNPKWYKRNPTEPRSSFGRGSNSRNKCNFCITTYIGARRLRRESLPPNYNSLTASPLQGKKAKRGKETRGNFASCHHSKTGRKKKR